MTNLRVPSRLLPGLLALAALLLLGVLSSGSAALASLAEAMSSPAAAGLAATAVQLDAALAAPVLEGYVFSGQVGDERLPFGEVRIQLFCSNTISVVGTPCGGGTYTNGAGWYGLLVPGIWEYYNIIEIVPAGYLPVGATSVGGVVVKPDWIQYTNNGLSGVLTDNKFWVDLAPNTPTASATATSANTATRTRTATGTMTATSSRTSTAIRTPTRTATRTPTPTPTYTSTPTRTPTSSVDLVADKIEVTQGIQDLNNSVRLVANKRTFVRFHVHSNGGNHNTFAFICAERDGSTTCMWPLNAGYTIFVRPSPDRSVLDQAFLFELPDGFKEGTVTLTAYLNPTIAFLRNPSPVEISYANNVATTAVSFEPVPPINVVLYRVEYWMFVGGTLSPSVAEGDQMLDWLRRAYPVSAVQSWRRSYSAGWGVAFGGQLILPDCGTVNAALLSKHGT
jgi:hypothetical protein